MMNWFVLFAGLLAAITTAFHLLSGGKEIARPLLASTLNDDVKLAMYACWHLVSVTAILSSLVLLAHATGIIVSPAAVIFISILWLLFTAVCLIISLAVAKPGGLLRLPQWLLLLPVGILGLVGVV